MGEKITQNYIPPVIIPIRVDDRLRQDTTFKNASYTETPGFTVLSIFYDEKEYKFIIFNSLLL